MRCPVCGYGTASTLCPRCGTDLRALEGKNGEARLEIVAVPAREKETERRAKG